MGVAVGSIAACVALTGGLALQHLGATTAAASKSPTTSPAVANRGDDGYGDDNNSGFPTDPFANSPANNGLGVGAAATGGAVTTSSGS